MAPKGTKSALAKELGMSRGMVYYRHKQPDKDEHLRRRIESVMIKHPGYGHKRVADDLKISRKRARRIMKLYGHEILEGDEKDLSKASRLGRNQYDDNELTLGLN